MKVAQKRHTNPRCQLGQNAGRQEPAECSSETGKNWLVFALCWTGRKPGRVLEEGRDLESLLFRMVNLERALGSYALTQFPLQENAAMRARNLRG